MRYLTVFLLLFATNASAAEWVHIAWLDAEGSELQVDNKSVVRVGKFRKAWSKWTYAQPEKLPTGLKKPDLNADHYSDAVALTYYNCAERTTADLQAVYRSAEGNVVGTFDNRDASLLSYSEVVPESLGEAMLDFVCEKNLEARPPKPTTPKPATPVKPTPEELRNKT